MSEGIGAVSRSDDAETEIELSTQELLALSHLQQSDEHRASPASKPSGPQQSAPRNKLSLLLPTIAAVGVMAATYMLSSSDGTNQSAVNQPEQIARSEWPAPQQLAEGQPVRFANPFDADEVFEFPPGTTEAEARDAVAEALLKRAMSRQSS